MVLQGGEGDNFLRCSFFSGAVMWRLEIDSLKSSVEEETKLNAMKKTVYLILIMNAWGVTYSEYLSWHVANT